LDAVRGFEWGWLPLILGLTSFNYLLRFAWCPLNTCALRRRSLK
jgi:hypothetical protein